MVFWVPLCQCKTITYATNQSLLYQCHQICVNKMPLHRENVCEHISVSIAIPLQRKHGLRWIFFSWCNFFHASVFTQRVMLTKGLALWHAVHVLAESDITNLGLAKGRVKMLYRGIELWQALKAIHSLVGLALQEVALPQGSAERIVL